MVLKKKWGASVALGWAAGLIPVHLFLKRLREKSFLSAEVSLPSQEGARLWRPDQDQV